MPIVLCRVDDRLVHGQVVVGWGRPLDLNRIVLVDDEVRQSPWEQELYRMAAPTEIAMDFLSPVEAAPRLHDWEAGRERVLVLVGTIGTAAELLRRAPGGCAGSTSAGSTPGRGAGSGCATCTCPMRSSRCSFVMAERGLEVSAQDVPTSRAVPLKDLG